MIAELREKRSDIARLCEEYGVIRLGVFGSAARGVDFKPESSDIDFLVLFDDRTQPDYLRRYFGLTDDLTLLLRREVELTTERQVKSPYLREAILHDLESIYVRPGYEAAA